MPLIPFLILSGGTAYAAFTMHQQQQTTKRQEHAAAEAAKVQVKPAEESISKTLAMDHIRLELGYGLLALVNSDAGQKLTDQIKGLRRQMASDMGFIMPAVRIQDNLQLQPNAYVIYIKEIEAGRGEVRPNMLMVMDPRGDTITLPGENTVEPTFGLQAMWVSPHYREEANFKGYTVVDPPTVMTTHLTEVIKDNIPELMTYSETQKLLDEMGKEQQKLVSDVIPSQITVTGLQRVLQNLLAERVSIRDLSNILEGVAEASAFTRNLTLITEHVRSRLARQISDDHTSSVGYIPILTLSPEWEQNFAESLVGQGEDKQLAMQPSLLQSFIRHVREVYEKHAMMGENPVLVTSPAIRPYVRSIIERFRSQTAVLSQNEIHAKAKIKTLGMI